MVKLSIYLNRHVFVMELKEPQSGNMYLPTCAPYEDSNQPAHPHEETLHHWLSKMRPVNILIRLCECASWSESSLGAHVKRYVSHVAVQIKD